MHTKPYFAILGYPWVVRFRRFSCSLHALRDGSIFFHWVRLFVGCVSCVGSVVPSTTFILFLVHWHEGIKAPSCIRVKVNSIFHSEKKYGAVMCWSDLLTSSSMLISGIEHLRLPEAL